MSVLEKGKQVNKKNSVIDPIYNQLMKSVKRSIGSTEFYDFFMDALTRANNEFQFSNRRVEKIVDLRWVNAIESSLDAIQCIINNPRNIIKEEELIVNVAHAKKGGSDVVRHLAQHGQLVEDFDEETGDVRPAKLMQKFREDSEELYENRLAFTTIEMAYMFTEIRYNALFAALGDEYGAKLKVNTNLDTATETIHFDTFIHIKEKESDLEKDKKNGDVFARIDRLHRLLTAFINSAYCQAMKNLPRTKGNIIKTNILKKNPNYRKICDLYDFLRHYDDVGYAIKIIEQNPQIDNLMVQNIYHNTLFQYIILKGYLEGEKERELPSPLKQKQRKIRPKVIREIIEELTEDYDITDVEVRKVLIDELTKDQLFMEEDSEKIRLLDEQLQRKKEEEAYRELLMEQDKERIRQELEEENERKRLEEEEAKRIAMVAELEQLRDDERRKSFFIVELEHFSSRMLERIDDRNALDEEDNDVEPIQDYIDAAKAIEDEEIRERLEEELRLQKIDDALRYPIYQREIINFFNNYNLNLDTRNVSLEYDDIEPIQDYISIASDIEDTEIVKWEMEIHEEFDDFQMMLHQKSIREKVAEVERVRNQMSTYSNDKNVVAPYFIELRHFNKTLLSNKKERTNYINSFNQINKNSNEIEKGRKFRGFIR